MPPFNRRSFLAASAAAIASPALGAVPESGEVDIAIVGAGAAGIAAARKVAAANRRFALIEASDHIGGRCITDTSIFGVPYDRGAHWLHMPDINPVVMLATRAGIDIYAAPPGQRMRVGRRYAREGEMEDFLAALVRTQRAIGDASRKADMACGQALPKDLGEWRQTVEFVLGPFGCAKELADVSALDFAKSAERDVDAFCRLGYGTLLAKLAEGIPVQFANPVTRIDSSGRGMIEVQTAKGKIFTRAVIVTASTGVLAADKIKFSPDVRRQLDAAAKLSLGSYDHIVLELPNNPLGLQRDDLMFEKSESGRTAALLANLSGTTLCMVDVAGKFGRDLSSKGEAAMVDFALDWLDGLYGSDLRKSVKRTNATRWNDEPWALGAFSAASPGNQAARRTLMESANGRVWFAGEAAHETLWGTVGGAWDSGERAATEALKKFTAPAKAKPPQRKRQPLSR